MSDENDTKRSNSLDYASKQAAEILGEDASAAVSESIAAEQAQEPSMESITAGPAASVSRDEFERVKATAGRMWTALFVAGGALAFSSASLFICATSSGDQPPYVSELQTQQSEMAASIAKVTQNVQVLTGDVDSLFSDVRRTNDAVRLLNPAAINARLDTVESNIVNASSNTDGASRMLTSDFAALQMDVAKLNDQFLKSQVRGQQQLALMNEQLKARTSALESSEQEIALLEAELEKVEKTVKTVAAKKQPRRPSVLADLAGLQVVQVDIWGNERQVVLRDMETDQWHSMTEGDVVRGYRILDVQPDKSQIVFQNTTNNRKVTVRVVGG